MIIDVAKAKAMLDQAASPGAASDEDWLIKVEKLSELCEQGGSKTHIAFLGTSILAKACDGSVDLYAIKPDHAQDNPAAYSARSLCHSTLVPKSAELGFSLGVTGREPLNNQPYFRMTRFGDGTPVNASALPAFEYLQTLIKELSSVSDAEAAGALAAFIAVRRRYKPSYAASVTIATFDPTALVELVELFVADASEGGRRAQAVVAGLLDVFAGSERVASGRINDPSRHYPGDVCVRSLTEDDKWEKAFEVRDKPVMISDIQIFANKCIAGQVREAAIVMTSPAQKDIDTVALTNWCRDAGVSMTLFRGWSDFIHEVLFWTPLPKPSGAAAALETIHFRLIAVEASEAAVLWWNSRIQTATS